MRKKRLSRCLSLICAFVMLTGLLAGCSEQKPTSTKPAETTAGTEPSAAGIQPGGSQMRHMTFNILGSGTDTKTPDFDNEAKRANMKAIIEEIDPDTFGVQEAPIEWTDGLPGLLDNKYAVVGGHSDPNVQTPARWTNALYYKVDTFTCLDSGMFYLNGDGSYISGKSTRSCSFALLERIEDGELLLILNLHLDHLELGTDELEAANYENYGIVTNQANILRDDQIRWVCSFVTAKSEEYAATYGKEVSVLISGDFNINAWEDKLYEHEYTRLITFMETINMFDTANVAAQVQPNHSSLEWPTYRKTTASTKRLDYIFSSGNLLVDTMVVHDYPYEIVESSDHRPVYIDYFIGH